MLYGFLLKFIGTISELFIPWILAYLIDTVVPARDELMIVISSIVMIICAICAFLFNVWANRISARASKRITLELRHDLFKKTCYLSRKQIDDFTTPSAISRLTSNTYDVNHMLSVFQRMGVRAPILLIGGIIITLTLDVPLTLVLIATLPFILLTVIMVSKKGIPLYTKTYESADKMVRVVRENATGIRIIKALSKSDYEKERFNYINEELSGKEKKASIVMNLTNPMMNLFLNLGFVALLAVGAYRVSISQMLPGKIIAFMTYFILILNALISITRLFVIYSKSAASSKRIFEVINAPQDLVLIAEDKVESDYHIEFSDVSFSYLKQANNLTGISFAVKKGETIGIIGEVGSGKTTIINLLMRFYDVDEGMIRINGENVKSIDFRRLYNMFGVAFQNDIIFADTISNNIDFYKGADDSQILKATEAAHASSFIENYEDKYNHKVAIKGLDLSGGQKQRILISRALSKNADIIILDDSSSALDYKTDALLRKSLRKSFNEATKIIVGQRISSIRHADIILVLDSGKIIGRGRHEDLLNDCPHYREIFDIQMGGVKDGK